MCKSFTTCSGLNVANMYHGENRENLINRFKNLFKQRAFKIALLVPHDCFNFEMIKEEKSSTLTGQDG